MVTEREEEGFAPGSGIVPTPVTASQKPSTRVRGDEQHKGKGASTKAAPTEPTRCHPRGWGTFPALLEGDKVSLLTSLAGEGQEQPWEDLHPLQSRNALLTPSPARNGLPKISFSPVTSPAPVWPGGHPGPAPPRAQTDDTKPRLLKEHHEPPARDQVKVQDGSEFSRNIIYTAEKLPAAIHHGLAAV